MSVQESRAARKQQGARLDRFEFAAEKKELPNLHSGFTEESTKQPGKSAFFLSIWFTDGQYKCCLMDRESNEKCFVDVGELCTTFHVLEEGLCNETLGWIDATIKSARAFGA